MRTALLALALSMLVAACGDDDTNSDPFELDEMTSNSENSTDNNAVMTTSLALECDDTESAVGLEGSVYVDLEDRANSAYDQPLDEFRQGVADIDIRLITDGEIHTAKTCDDGTFRFGALPTDKAFFIDPDLEGRVTTTNDTRFTAAALEAGEFDLVVFGDSVPAYGPTPWFPNVLRPKFDAFGEAGLENIAVPGSKSFEWLPGTTYYDDRLKAQMADADLIVFSLGGNDLQDFAFSLQGANPTERIGELQPLIDEVKANLKTIIAQIQQDAPNADIAWMLYPNYATSTEWQNLLGQYASAGERLIGNLLAQIRADLADVEGLVIIDMLEATADTNLDDILVDPLHLNTVGHALYADIIFQSVGGIEAGETPVRYDYGLAP